MITQTQIDSFHRDGFLVIRKVFPESELETLRKAAGPIIEEGVSFRGTGHNYHEKPDGSRVYWGSAPVQNRSEDFRAAAARPDLLEAVGQCIGHAFLPINAALVTKLVSNGAPVRWHQDPPYNKPQRTRTFEIPNFTADIYLDRATVENSCLWGIPGCHLAGHVDLGRYSQEELFAKGHPIEMEAGDVLFHSLSSPHGSASNQSQNIRRILYIHFMGKEVTEDGYPEWTYPAPPEARKLAGSYLELRKDRPSPHIEVTDEGFFFSGAPSTPPRHWKKLMDAVSEEERERVRSLDIEAGKL